MLWLKLFNTGTTYTFSGHASLRHKRFHDSYGYYPEGLAPGANELAFCGQFNANKNGPSIIWPMKYGINGPFAHIGEVSLADIQPKNK